MEEHRSEQKAENKLSPGCKCFGSASGPLLTCSKYVYRCFCICFVSHVHALFFQYIHVTLKLFGMELDM